MAKDQGEPPAKKTKTKSDNWQHAILFEKEGKMACKYCNNKTNFNITKFGTHLQKCEAFLRAQKKVNQLLNGTPLIESTAFYGACLEETRKTVIELLAKAIISANVPFTFTENRYLIRMFQLLKVEIPREKAFRTNLVDTVHDEATAWINQSIQKSLFISIRLDSFKTESNNHVSSVAVKTMSKTLFYKVVDIEDSRANADYYAKVFIDIIQEIGEFTFS